MSFPSIPDFKPNMELSLEDSINLILVSVALEEISLSELISAEAKKLEAFLNQCKDKKIPPELILDINRSIDSTLKNIIKLQMLLQFKLDNVKEIIPVTTTTSSTTTSTTTTMTSTCSKTTTTKSTSTTTSHSTTCTTSTCTTTSKKPCSYGITGKVNGFITNRCDRFDGQMATAEIYTFNDDIENNSIRYYAGNDCYKLFMNAKGNKVRINYLCPNKIVFSGKGYMHLKEKHNPVYYNCKFKLLIWFKPGHIIEFNMIIDCCERPELSHNSGIIQDKNMAPDSQLFLYPNLRRFY